MFAAPDDRFRIKLVNSSAWTKIMEIKLSVRYAIYIYTIIIIYK